MTGHGMFLKFFTSINNYKPTIINRLTVTNFLQPNAGLKSDIKDKLKTLKVPEQPKRPLTPYLRFLNEHRDTMHKEHPDWKVVDITKQCALDWKSVAVTLKEKYKQDFVVDMEEYHRKQKAFTASLTEEQAEALKSAQQEKRADKKKRNLRKQYRETGKPKRPTSSFLYFIKEKLELTENKNMKLTEALVELGRKWRALTNEQKQKYVDLNSADKIRYETEMAKWETNMVREGKVDIIRKDSQIIGLKPNRLQKPKDSKPR